MTHNGAAVADGALPRSCRATIWRSLPRSWRRLMARSKRASCRLRTRAKIGADRLSFDPAAVSMTLTYDVQLGLGDECKITPRYRMTLAELQERVRPPLRPLWHS